MKFCWLIFILLLSACSLGKPLPYVNEPMQHTFSPQDFGRFGVVEGMWFPDVTCELGVGWERIIFNWREHQPNNADEWLTFQVPIEWLQAAQACEREVVALIKDTPQWATTGQAGIGVPSGLDLPLDDPNNTWARFIRQLVDYYQPLGVTHYIIWNEPDIDSSTYGYEFAGTLDDYFLMLKTAYLVAKELNPDVQIHLAGTTYWHDVNEGRETYMTRLVQRIKQDPDSANHGYYFDVLSLHIYFRNDSIPRIVGIMRKMLDDNGLADKAIWINETNAAPTDDPNWQVIRPVFMLNLEHQAAYLLQATALGLASGAERIAVYKLWDQFLPEGGESFGLLNPASREPRPAYTTWQMINQHFADVISAQRIPTEQADIVRLIHTDGEQSFILWARTEQSTEVSISATDTEATLMTQYGNISSIQPENGQYHLTLSPALCEEGQGCFLGGQVQILVQKQGQTTVRNQNQDLEFPAS